MKLAEALKLRQSNQKHIDDLRNRLQSNAVIQEGSEPLESIPDLLDDLEKTTSEQVALIYNINRTNNVVEIEVGVTITAALAARDVLTVKRNVLVFLVTHTANALHVQRIRNTELRSVSMVDVAGVQRQIDYLGAELRRLDLKVQERNWSADLVE